MAEANATQGSAVAKAKDERTQPIQQKITTFLWFDKNAEEAANFYVSIFKNSSIRRTAHYGDSSAGPKGTVMTIDFQLDGQEFTALNGGPEFKFNEAISQVVHCNTQEEVDYFWEKLSAGGQILECGWLKDKFGLAWQIVPDVLLELIQDDDQQRRDRVMKAMMKMKKLDVAKLKQAANEH
ncbi:MAG TPA: VOC family protein [Pyrinomonadaceae bacterium]|jgi:predicted 3-demethylubiquinone-9 3-methyltransferase (glyoxalase superfamily)|nr:VOC family protein [Pyrinomonadaceae bacterium]